MYFIYMNFKVVFLSTLASLPTLPFSLHIAFLFFFFVTKSTFSLLYNRKAKACQVGNLNNNKQDKPLFLKNLDMRNNQILSNNQI